MDVSVFALLVFAGLATACGAVALAIRDLVLARRGAEESAQAPLRLRCLPPAPQSGSAGAVGAFDRWFLRLVKETGTSWSPTEACLLLVLCGAVVGGAIFVFSDHPLAAVLGVFLGMGAALTYLVVRRARHIRTLQDQLPAALDMLARSMRAGLSIDESVQMAGQQLPEPLAREFRYAANQLALGLSMPAVMRSLVDRVRLFDVRIFTTTLTVHRQTGGNLALVLERLAGVVRDRLNYRRQLRSTTGAGRFSALMIAAMGPLLFVYMFFFHPDYIHAMLHSPVGQAMLVAAFALEAIGLIWTARLLKPMY